MSGGPPDNRGPVLFLVFLAMAALIARRRRTRRLDAPRWGAMPAPHRRRSVSSTSGSRWPRRRRRPGGTGTSVTDPQAAAPHAGRRAGCPAADAAGGATDLRGRQVPGRLLRHRRDRRARRAGGDPTPSRCSGGCAARRPPFRAAGEPIQIVYELIVSIADRVRRARTATTATTSPRAAGAAYIDAAHRHGALLLLDLQPGRSDFLDRRQALGLGAEGPVGRPGPRPRVADGPPACPRRRIGLGRRRRGQPGLGLAGATWSPATGCRRSCSCCTSSARR